jgi:uncharacterized protein YndB with AHSA1/START domain
MTDAGESGEVRLEIRIDASHETVFALLTDPTQMRIWLAEIVEADARPDGVFRISDSGLTIEGTYLEVVPCQKVMFTWGGVEGLKPGQTTVEFLLEGDGSGTLLRLRHYNLPKSVVDVHRQGSLYSELVKLERLREILHRCHASATSRATGAPRDNNIPVN